jgi:diaminohydroxyphosphoribosylaminopyrimidine deaminase/5-amino-6-(5-phosphoribosylamino)uracil reductase
MGEFDKLMARAFKLAGKGLGYTSPNPPVGAILIKDGVTIATGYHRRAGMPHAEIEAIKMAGEKARGSTLITTLEPCSHQGKTPPCDEAIIAAGIIRVISAISDPNPKVAGNGYKRLRASGVDIIDGVLAEQAREFYRPYFKFITTGMPFVTLKFAQSIDGRIATRIGHSQWISSPESLVLSHKLRGINDAILVGSGTLRKDNPQLTTRLVKGLNPIRIVLSQSGKFPLKRALFTDGQSPTFVATSVSQIRNSKRPFEFIALRKQAAGLNLRDLLRKLGEMGIVSLLVEGGGGVLTSFMKQRLVNKLVVCIAPMVIGKGIEAMGDLGIAKIDKAINFENPEIKQFGTDIVFSGYPIWSQ